MVGDPVGDFIVQIKNASLVGKVSVVVPYSKLKHEIARVLEEAGYLTSVTKKGRKLRKHLEVGIAYENGTPKMRNTKRISKPSRRVYVAAKDIKPVKRGFGHVVLSTPKGILVGKEARAKSVGGEILFEIW